MRERPAWSQYQQDVADFFRRLGCNAQTDAKVQGSRTSHDVDVLVTIKLLQFDLLWLVECKHWKTKVTKEKVLALRTIVSDVGADRGLLLCEKGYQKGALEAAQAANVRLISLADLEEICRDDIAKLELRQLYLVANDYRKRYWALDKEVRIANGLKNEIGGPYNGDAVAKACEMATLSALFYGCPAVYDTRLSAFATSPVLETEALPDSFVALTPSALVAHVTTELQELDRRLQMAEQRLS